MSLSEHNTHRANGTSRQSVYSPMPGKMPAVLARLDEMRAELAAVLSSKYFSRAPTLVQFLSYVCEKYFHGQAEQIKEYTVAVEAFGRPDSFEPKRDPIVRVDANRLRLRLLKYYRHEGRTHPIRISLPTGQYVPMFEFLDDGAAKNEPLVAAAEELPALSEAVNHQPGTNGTGPRGHDLQPVVCLPQKSNGNHRRRRISPPIYSLAGLLVAILTLSVISLRWSSLPLSQADPLPIPASSVPTLPGGEVRILCANSAPRYIDQVGRIWAGDRFFSGGETFATDVPVARSEDPVIWQKGRQGNFGYDIPLSPDIYELRLYFAEPVYGVNQREGGGETNRLFDVLVNSEPVLKVFDIVADAGGTRTADVKVLTDISPASDGYLHLRFMSRKSKALLNAVELVPGIPGRIRPIQITTSSFPVYSTDQTLWGADRYFSGGSRVSYTEHVLGSESPQIYGSERFGNFTYCIPVASGSYTIRLHFREAWFGSENGGKGGAGSRIFDVHCNGLILLKDFDIFTEAGGADQALAKEFRGLRANPQGKLILTFQPTENYACISALEVIQEAE